ncbi:hypothetical protein GGE45_003896 [Rhizobium aethiopicum]|nr:hypothetical protein [Rhizobium aethiopicum]
MYSHKRHAKGRSVSRSLPSRPAISGADLHLPDSSLSAPGGSENSVRLAGNEVPLYGARDLGFDLHHYWIDRFGCVCSPCGQPRWQFENSSYAFRSNRLKLTLAPAAIL